MAQQTNRYLRESQIEKNPSLLGEEIRDQPKGMSTALEVCASAKFQTVVLGSINSLNEGIARQFSAKNPFSYGIGPIARDSIKSKPKKASCSCKKSRCLKLYCDCFASAEYCDDCGCLDCRNTQANERERRSAMSTTKGRNPDAFNPKIAVSAGNTTSNAHHSKGCNCRRSGCLKKYCECYQAGIKCGEFCKCTHCRNFELCYVSHQYLEGHQVNKLSDETPLAPEVENAADPTWLRLQMESALEFD